jgi:hypothetical protein
MRQSLSDLGTSHNVAFWNDLGFGALNPRALSAKLDLHPNEIVEVLAIPLIATTPFPFSVAIEYWLRDQKSGRQSIRLMEPPLENDVTFDFQPGELEVDAGFDGGFVQSQLSISVKT